MFQKLYTFSYVVNNVPLEIAIDPDLCIATVATKYYPSFQTKITNEAVLVNEKI
jgi:hypothetical protein